MKKLLAIALVGMLILTGCGSKGDTPETPATPSTGDKVKVGTGIVNSVKTAGVEGEKAGKFESNVTYATVVIKDDKFESVTIDTAQNAVEFTADKLNEFVARKTKKELGDEYGMSAQGKVEWDKQIADLEAYLVGKSVSEITAETAATDLNSTVSIKIEGYIEAVKLAVANAVELEGVAKVAQASSVSAKTEDAAKVEINTVVTAVAVDAEGNVLHAFIDEAQLKAAITGATAVANEELRTKAQRGDADYGMNWTEQVKTITDWAVGKNADAVAKASSDADVTSTVSIYVDHFVATLVSAIKAAK